MNAPATAMPQLDPYDLKFLRNQICAVLRAQDPASGSALGTMASKPLVKREQKLSRPNATYQDEILCADGSRQVVERVKPDHDQWTTTHHATATRPPGFSREVISPDDFRKARYVRAIASLQSRQIQSINARYSPSNQVRDNSSRRLASWVASRHRTAKVKRQARVIALMILRSRPSTEDFCEALGMSYEEWRGSRTRKLVTTIKADLSRLDVDSLLAWEAACKKN